MVGARALVALVLLTITAPAGAQTTTGFVDSVRDRLRNRLEAASATQSAMGARGDRLHARTMLPLFYERRLFIPAWIGESGLLPRARMLAAEIRKARDEGLRPDDYHLAAIDAVLADAAAGKLARTDVAAWAAADLLFTDAFLLYGSHLLSGRVNPATFDSEWHANRREADMADVLERAVSSDDVARALRGLLPAHPAYATLKRALARYRAIDGWQTIPAGPTLRLGDMGPRVQLVAARLAATADLAGRSAGRETFDEDVERAVRRFQTRHGLTADGAVGATTLTALNVPAADRIEQIRINLERWRWLSQDLGRRYILVNIPAFELEVVEDGRSILDMRVVVGREYRRTPVFSSRMTHLVLNPYWHVTRNIAVSDKLPLIRKDPGYLAAQKMKVFEETGGGRREVDPSTIDWSSVTPQTFRYQLRQDPGPQNALGRVKFMFPNQFNVYLHDTPTRELFNETARSFSSGCIRLHQPIDLAVTLLAGTDWTPAAIDQALAKRQDFAVTLREPVPVHLQYWTAWSDDNLIHLRPDIYGRDKLLSAALAQTAPK